jgi:hypothetical protein
MGGQPAMPHNEFGDNPGSALSILGAGATTYGPLPAITGVTYEDWIHANWDQAQQVYQTDGAMALHELWLQQSGASSAPPPQLVNPFDAATSSNPLVRAGQVLAAAPEFASGWQESQRQGTLSPFLVNMAQQIVEDPTTLLEGPYDKLIWDPLKHRALGAIKDAPIVRDLVKAAPSTEAKIAGEEASAAMTEQITARQAAVEAAGAEPRGAAGEPIPTPEQGLAQPVQILADGTTIERQGDSYVTTRPDGSGAIEHPTLVDAERYAREQTSSAVTEARRQQQVSDQLFRQEQDRVPLVERTAPLSGATQRIGPEHPLYGEVRSQLDAHGLVDMGIRLTDNLSKVLPEEQLRHLGAGNPSAMTDVAKRLITVAVQHASDADFGNALSRIRSDINHEVIHATRQMDLFTNAEWNTLVQTAHRLGIPDQMDAFYRGMATTDRAMYQEEMVAHLYEFYRQGKLLSDTPAAPILERMRLFLESLGQGLRNQYPDVILHQIETGEIGRRPRESGFVAGGEPPFARAGTPTDRAAIRTAAQELRRPYHVSGELARRPGVLSRIQEEATARGYDGVVVWDGELPDSLHPGMPIPAGTLEDIKQVLGTGEPPAPQADLKPANCAWPTRSRSRLIHPRWPRWRATNRSTTCSTGMSSRAGARARAGSPRRPSSAPSSTPTTPLATSSPTRWRAIKTCWDWPCPTRRTWTRRCAVTGRICSGTRMGRWPSRSTSTCRCWRTTSSTT